MFRWYHKNVKPYERWIFGAILIIIVISFAASGVAYEVGEVISGDGKSKGSLALEAGDMKVTREEFDDLVFRWDRADYSPTLSMQQGSRISLFVIAFFQHFASLYEGTEQMLMRFALMGRGGDKGITRKLAAEVFAVLSAAKAEGLRVSDEEVKQHIREHFGGRTGGFVAGDYMKQVEFMGMRPEQYEKSVQEFLLVQKYMSMVSEGVAVATQDVLNEYIASNGRAKAKYATLEAADFRTKALRRVSQQRLARQLESSKAAFGFKREASGRLEYLFVSADKARPLVAEPTEEELRKYYDEHKSEFELPIHGPRLPEDMTEPGFDHDHDHDHDHDGTADASPENPVLPDPHRKFEDVKAEVATKVKDSRARAKADELGQQVSQKILNMRMNGQRPEFGVLAQEFKVDVGTTAWFEEMETKSVEDQLGTVETGQPTMSWGTFLRGGVNEAIPVKVRTSKGVVFARLAEKREPEAYLATERMRAKAAQRLAQDGARELARKEAEAVKAEFAKKWSEAYAEKVKAGQSLTDEQLADLRFQVFTDVAAARKLDLKETPLVTREERIPDVADARPFTTALFSIEEKARGEVQIADGSSATYLVQLVSRRPATATGFTLKRKQIEDRLMGEKRRKFVSEMLNQYKKEHVKVHIELPSATLPPELGGG